MQNKIIWLMGGSGSGKSTLAEILRSLGLKVVDADEISKNIMDKGQSAYFETIAAFGAGILLPDGAIDRKKLGEQVFFDSEKLRILNRITHKYIKEQLILRVGEGTAVIDAALPPDGFVTPSYLIFVTADKNERVKRIIIRDSISEEHARNRIASQLSVAEYEKMADVVFCNNGDINELKNRVEKWCKDEKII